MTSLQHRYKWTKETPNIKIGAIVLVKDSNSPPSKWLLARVENVHHGEDGHVRVVTYKSATGTYTRPIAKLIPLPFSESLETFSRPQNDSEWRLGRSGPTVA